MNRIKNKIAGGFTLVEILIYLFAFSVLVSASLGMLFSLNDLFVQYKLKQTLLVSGEATINRILLEIREADSIDLASSNIATSTIGSISLVKDTSTVLIQKSSNNLNLYQDGLLTSQLQSPDVQVVGCTFFHYEVNGVTLVRVKLILNTTLGNSSEEVVFSGGAIIRGSYDKTP